MPANTAIVLGATGQVGNLLVDHLLQDPFYDRVRVLVRRPYDREDPKLESRIVDFKNLTTLKESLGEGLTIFCCIGTTMKQVKGDKSLYREIDYDIPVNVARLAIENGIFRYMLVSAVGANPQSKNFYLRLKGEVEEQLKKLPFGRIYLMRPSLLMGPRKDPRLMERISKVVMKPLSFLFKGKLLKYRPIEASDVALAMIVASTLNIPSAYGIQVCEYAEMMDLISKG
ncbi:NAD(P)H-binding protein [Flavitalea flava]